MAEWRGQFLANHHHHRQFVKEGPPAGGAISRNGMFIGRIFAFCHVTPSAIDDNTAINI